MERFVHYQGNNVTIIFICQRRVPMSAGIILVRAAVPTSPAQLAAWQLPARAGAQTLLEAWRSFHVEEQRFCGIIP